MADVLQYIIRVRGGRQGKREADQTAEGFDNLAAAAARAQAAVGGAGLASSLNNVSGRLRLAVAGAALFGPALIAVGASASAAAAGGAAVAGGGLTALATGLAGFGIIAGQATGDLKKVRTALDQYHMVVAQHGRYSLEAYRAERTLFAAVGQNGGRQVLQTARAISALGTAWRRATTGARANVFGVITDAIGGARRLLPTFARETTRNSSVIRQALSTAFRSLSGGEIQRNITSFSHTFRTMAGPLTRGFVNIFIVLGRIFRSASPYATALARSFESWTQSWRRGTADGAAVGGVIEMLVSNTKSWWGLIKAVGYVLGGLFTNSVASGQSLVDSLTGVLTTFGDWMRTAEGQQKVRQWFRDSANAVRDVGNFIVDLSTTLYPFLMFVTRHLKTIVALWLGWKGAVLAVRTAIFLLNAALLISQARVAGFGAGMAAMLAQSAAGASMAPVAAALAGGLALALPAALIAAGIAGIVMAALLPHTAPGTDRSARTRNTLDATKPHGPRVPPGTSWFERTHPETPKNDPARRGDLVPDAPGLNGLFGRKADTSATPIPSKRSNRPININIGRTRLATVLSKEIDEAVAKG